MNMGEVKKVESKTDPTIGVVFEKPVKNTAKTRTGNYVKQGFTALVKVD